MWTRTVTDGDLQELQIPKFTKRGHGYKIISYLPSKGQPLEQADTKKRFIQWSFQQQRDFNDTSMQEIHNMLQNTKSFRKSGEESWSPDTGTPTWSWPRLKHGTQTVPALRACAGMDIPVGWAVWCAGVRVETDGAAQAWHVRWRPGARRHVCQPRGPRPGVARRRP